MQFTMILPDVLAKQLGKREKKIQGENHLLKKLSGLFMPADWLSSGFNIWCSDITNLLITSDGWAFQDKQKT